LAKAREVRAIKRTGISADGMWCHCAIPYRKEDVAKYIENEWRYF
jgi:hypothetical protein